MNRYAISLISALCVAAMSCTRVGTETKAKSPTLFELRSADETGIDFANNLEYTEELNPYIFRNFYNGGGVGLGDINNDGLPDIFFSGNLVPNKLYLNKGGFKFQDISISSGLGDQGAWTTGVSMVDINADGYLDIYICKSGPPGGAKRHNELFINNGDLTFTEKALEYGLGSEGLSTHAVFFDFDKDGDLDCYLLNNSLRSVGGYDLRRNQRNIPDPEGGNRLYRNDSGKFTDVSQVAGIYSSAIGFGLGVTIGDVNKDGWQDMYVSNDFFEKDYLYINNQNGTFSESIETYMREISLGSMGADMADINNDGLPEIFVTEMLPETDERLKTTSQFENWDKYRLNVDKGYYHQFSRNVLQLNNGDGTFSEISRLAGVHATDWSWGALIFDLDNDGFKDIFVANGIYKDLLNQDYVNFIANPATVRQILSRKNNVIKQLIDSIPSNKISNYAFRNDGNLRFSNRAQEWGLGDPSHSNGSAYGDLDNDGDLDLVLNNVNMPAFLFENKAKQQIPENATISFSLHGDKPNPFALGAKITIRTSGKTFYQELSPMRGFMSSVDYRLHFGLGKQNLIDSIIVTWPDMRQTILTGVGVNQLLELRQSDAVAINNSANPRKKPALVFDQPDAGSKGIGFVHEENEYSDFDRDRLLFNMVSNEGPCVCAGDINTDGLDDFYIGGAKGQAGTLYIQKRNGSFETLNKEVFEKDKSSEDTGCIFFDANGDRRQDLYVTSGGPEFPSTSNSLLDRLYLNAGGGRMERSPQLLPVSTRFESTSAVTAADYDNDGDADLFVGARLVPSRYGLPANGYILNNEEGKFTDVTQQLSAEISAIGMITDAKWIDVNNDRKTDLLIVGEWMEIRLFINTGEKFEDRTKEFGLSGTSGWYQAIEVADFNKDGFPDFVVGNHGLNSRFKATVEQPVRLYVSDFDQNGSIEQIHTRFDGGVSYPMVLRHDLLAQMPSLKKKYLHFDRYKGQQITDIFTPEQLKNALVLTANTFETAVWINSNGAGFEKRNLPVEAQFSPVYAILPDDFDEDGNIDLLLGGNLSRAKPETGIYSGSYGILMKGDGSGNFVTIPATRSGVQIKGEVRGIAKLKTRQKHLIVIGMNNNQVQTLAY